MISCDVILDLLPLYADGQASESSAELIRKHTEECETCAAVAKSMAMPLELNETEKKFSDIAILRRQRQRMRLRILFACIIAVTVCFLVWWLYMETHFTYETPVIVSESTDEILAKMPQLAFTQEEKAFAQKLYTIPILNDAIKADELRILTWDSMVSDLASVLPEGAMVNEVSSSANSVYIDYQFEELRYILTYIDPNNDNTVDMIRKTIGDGDVAGKGARTVHEAQYLPILDMVSYEKWQLKHIWFGFLRME